MKPRAFLRRWFYDKRLKFEGEPHFEDMARAFGQGRLYERKYGKKQATAHRTNDPYAQS